jgi:carboxymethylenebutenolidase
MCHAADAYPPRPPVGGAAASSGDLVLEGGDGNRFAAYFARAAESTGTGIVVMPDVRGLHPFYKELAVRFAEAGVDAVAIDYFGRTAGIAERTEDFHYRPHVEKTTPQDIAADVAAAVEHLRSAEGGHAQSVFTVGFCFGGANSWRQSAEGHRLAGCIGFYGIPDRVKDAVPRMRAPLLILVAGADFTPLTSFQQFDRELAAAGVPHQMHVYDGAPHSFFDRAYSEWSEACDDAWRRVLDFVRSPTGVQA